MTTPTTPTSGAADRAIENCPELNMGNYDEVDVERLNDWAIRANDEIDRLHALAAGQATAAQQAPEYPFMPETWHVVANVLGEPILSIGYNWLSGKGELTEAETQAVIGMAQHMLAFVGYGLPPSSFDPDADEATAAQPAAQQGAAYAELPMQFACSGVFPVYSADQMRAFADRTYAMRTKSEANREFLERVLSAMEGVIDVADRKTDEFDALRSCIVDLTLMLFKPDATTASHGQAPAGAVLPAGWVPLTITHEGQHPEEVAYGPQIMMDRLGKWLVKYFAQAARSGSVLEGAAHAARTAQKDTN